MEQNKIKEKPRKSKKRLTVTGFIKNKSFRRILV